MFDSKGNMQNNLYVKCLVILLLSGAIVTANYVGDLLAWLGIVYYLICMVAVLKNYRKACTMLWAAVGVHAVLVGQSLWNWYSKDIEPCPYCYAAAGLILVAATVLTRIQVAVLPLIIMFVVGYSWPGLFAPKSPVIPYMPQITETTSKPSEPQKPVAADPEKQSEAENQPVETVNPHPPSAVPSETSLESNHNPGPAVEMQPPVQPEQNANLPETDGGKAKPETKAEEKPKEDVKSPPDEEQSKSG